MSEQQLDAFSEDTDLQQMLADLQGLDPADRDIVIERMPDTIRTLMAVFESELRGQVKDPRKSAQRMVIAMAHYLGGRHQYLPRDERLKVMLRNIEIYQAQCKGASIESLAAKYELTPIRIYQIVGEWTAISRARRQPDMFESLT